MFSQFGLAPLFKESFSHPAPSQVKSIKNVIQRALKGRTGLFSSTKGSLLLPPPSRNARGDFRGRISSLRSILWIPAESLSYPYSYEILIAPHSCLPSHPSIGRGHSNAFFMGFWHCQFPAAQQLHSNLCANKLISTFVNMVILSAHAGSAWSLLYSPTSSLSEAMR